jgi:hypothetical protein
MSTYDDTRPGRDDEQTGKKFGQAGFVERSKGGGEGGRQGGLARSKEKGRTFGLQIEAEMCKERGDKISHQF